MTDKFFSRNYSSRKSNLVQSNEIMIHDYANWNIREVKVDMISQIGTFSFQTAYSIKTHEETISIQEEYQSIHSLSNTSLKNTKRKIIDIFILE